MPLTHLLCCSPSADNPALQTFDSYLRSAISKITNSALSDIQCLHAFMPIAHGGLGVRRVSSLGIPAFLASAASTLPLQDDIISLCLCPTDSSLEQYLSMWSSSAGPPPDPLPRKQSFWTGLVFRLTVHASSPHLLSRRRERDSWLRRRHTVVTGFLLCLLLTVAYASTTRQCE